MPSNTELDKIHVGWNVGLSYYGRWRHYLEYAAWKQHRLYRLLKPRFYSPKKPRDTLCSGRFAYSYQRKTSSLPRRLSKEKLQGTLSMDKVSMRHYFRELRSSYTCLSPFGLGESSLRDFEIVLSGAAIIKQNMDHLETWPNLWETGKTYLDFAWDLSDLKSKLEYARSHPEEIQGFAIAAQEKYRIALRQKHGPGSFTEHLLELIS